MDLMGFDYGPEMYDKWHAEAPGVPAISSETSSAYSDRGNMDFGLTVVCLTKRLGRPTKRNILLPFFMFIKDGKQEKGIVRVGGHQAVVAELCSRPYSCDPLAMQAFFQSPKASEIQ